MLQIPGNEGLRPVAAWHRETKAAAVEKGGELSIWDDWETGGQGWEILSLSSEGKVKGRVGGEMM